MPLRRSILRPLIALVLALLLVDVGSPQDKLTQPIRRFGTTAFRHGSRVQSLLFLPDGKLLAGGGNDPVRLWDLETGKFEKTYPDAWTQALAVDPNHSRFVAAGALRALRLHGIGEAEVKLKLETAPSGIRAAAFSPDGNHLLAGCTNGMLLHVPFDGSLNPLTKIDDHKEEVNAVAWTPDGQTALGASADRTIRVWRLDGKKLMAVTTYKTPAPVRAMVLGPQGLTIWEAGDDGVIRVRELATGNVLFTFEGHRGIVQSLALVGKTLVSGGYNGELRVWDTARRTLVRTIPRSFGDDDALALSPDGKRIAVGGDNGVIRIFDVDTGKERRLAEGPTAGLAKSVRTPKHLVAVARNGEVAVWDAASGQMTATWTTRRTPNVQQEFVLAVSPEADLVVTGTSTEPALELWDMTGKSLGTLPLPAGENVLSTAFSGSGKMLALGYRSGLLQILEGPERKVRHTLKAAGPVTTLAFGPDAPIVAAGIGSHVQIFDVPTGQDLRKIPSKADIPVSALPRIAELAFSPDGRTMGLASYDGVVRLIDWTSGKHLADCDGHTSAVLGIAFAPDGRTFATASFDKTVRIWETFLGKSIAVCSTHAGPATSVGFSSDGRIAYSASVDTTMAAWDATISRIGDASSTPLNEQDFRKVWVDLASDDPVVGVRAQWRLCGSAVIAERIGKAVYLVDPARVDRLFTELSDDLFPIREKATLELKSYGRWMEGRYEIALRDPPSVEAKRRIEWLHDLLQVKDAMTLKQERLRVHRAFSILEQLGDSASRNVLEDLVKRAPEVDLQKQAEQSLARIVARRSAS